MSTRYTKDHEWARLDGDVVTIGISKYAVEKLTNVVYVELPREGETLAAGAALGVVESSKAVSDVYAPVSGTVAAINTALNDGDDDVRLAAMKKVEDDAEGDGWFLKLTPSNPAELDELMDEADYAEYVKDL